MNTTDASAQPTTCSAIDLHLHGEAPALSSGTSGHMWVTVGPAAIHGDRELLRSFATSILEQLETTGVDTVVIADLVVGDEISVPSWPEDRWEIVHRFSELAPGILDLHVESGSRFTWPADHAVQVKVPRPGAAVTRERGVPCRGLHGVGRKPIVWANDGLCADCREARTPPAEVVGDGEGPYPLLEDCDASCASSYGVGDHWCRPQLTAAAEA